MPAFRRNHICGFQDRIDKSHIQRVSPGPSKVSRRMESAVFRISHNAAALKQISAAIRHRLPGRCNITAGSLIGIPAEAEGTLIKVVVAISENVICISFNQAVLEISFRSLICVKGILAAEHLTVIKFRLIRVDQQGCRPLSGGAAHHVCPQRPLKADAALTAVGETDAVLDFLFRHIIIKRIFKDNMFRPETVCILCQIDSTAPAGRLIFLIFVIGTGRIVKSVLTHAVIFIPDAVIPGDFCLSLLRIIVHQGNSRYIHRHLLPVCARVEMDGDSGFLVRQPHGFRGLHRLCHRSKTIRSIGISHIEVGLQRNGIRRSRKGHIQISYRLPAGHSRMGFRLIPAVRSNHGRLINSISQLRLIGLAAAVRRFLYLSGINLSLAAVCLDLRKSQRGHFRFRRQMEQTALHRVKRLFPHRHGNGQISRFCLGLYASSAGNLIIIQAGEHRRVPCGSVQNSLKSQFCFRLP